MSGWIVVVAVFRHRIGKHEPLFEVGGSYRAEPEGFNVDWVTQEGHEDDVLQERELRQFGLWEAACDALRSAGTKKIARLGRQLTPSPWRSPR